MSRFALIVLSSLSLLGCWNEVDGGPEVSKTRTLQPFTKLRVESGLAVKLEPGAPSVTITAPEKVEEHLQTLLIDGTLVVRIRPSVRVTDLGSTEVVVSGEGVEAVQVIRGSEASVSGVAGEVFTGSASGGGRLVLSGTATELRLEVSEGSTALARGVAADYVSLSVSGGSNVEVNASKVIGGTASGGSTVLVDGAAEYSTIYATEGSTVGRAQ